MTVRGFLCAVPLVALLVATVVAQGPRGPRTRRSRARGRRSAAESGATLFRARCAECHGADGKGVAGHDLTRLLASGATDDRVFQTIRNGVPNTLMPSSSAPDGELRALVAYLRSLNGPARDGAASRQRENGERLFAAKCSACHAINGRGGRLGPDFSRIGQSRDQLAEAIRSPAASIPTDISRSRS